MPDRLLALAEEIVRTLGAQKQMLVGAESCTAGLASDFLARVPGASNVLWGSFIAYTADAKIKMLGVPEELIEQYGPVSQHVALAMAEGALKKSGAFWAFSVTGFAGPTGDGGRTPVGTVWIGIAGQSEGTFCSQRAEAVKYQFSGSRNEVRKAAAIAALEEVLERIRL